jgi:hypothetical protein
LDTKIFLYIKKLLKILKELDEKDHYREAFKKMAKALGGKTGIRTYFGLLRLEEWWYLVFRTHKGRGAYLFLRLLKQKQLLDSDKEISDEDLGDFIANCENWNQAKTDSDSDVPESDTKNTAKNNIGPNPGEGGGSGIG